MRCIVVNEQGGPERLQLEECPVPEARAGEILVRTHAAGVNFYDTYVRSGVYDSPMPFTPGKEGAGTVEAVGEGVTSFAPGDRVATVDASGSYAEFFRVKAELAARVPDHVDMDVAAAMPLQGLTAHYLATSIAPPHALDVRIGSRFALADAAQAHEALEGRKTTGKVILTV